MVFRYPPQPTISYIKRVIGLPGDHIVYDHGQLTINGEKVAKVPVEFSREKIVWIRQIRFIIKKPLANILSLCVSWKESM